MKQVRAIQQGPIWSWRELRGESLYLHGRQVTPISRALTLRWAGGGLLWQHPLAVEVREGKDTYRLRVPDVTRRATIALYLLAAALVLGSATLGKRHRPRND